MIKRVFHNFRRLCIGINSRVHRYTDLMTGIDVMAEDWDTLVLLDGARYDFFREQMNFDGVLESRVSPGSNSPEFIRSTFTDRHLHDTVYVTTNPYVHLLSGDEFHEIENLLKSDWNERVETVLPEIVTKRVVEAHRKFPQKRIIAHYMQPHFPFLGPTGRKFEHAGIAEETSDIGQGMNPWFELIDIRKVPPETVVRAYRENYRVVWPAIETLLDKIEGRVVITADHGNLIGERTWPIPVKVYGHPLGIRHPNLRRIPWAIHETGFRREIVADPPKSVLAQEESDMQDQLDALGYK